MDDPDDADARDLAHHGRRSAPHTPRAIELGAHGEPIGLGDYLELDDTVITFALHEWEKASDPVLRDLSTRIRNRALFKTLELFGEQASPVGRESALAEARSIAEARGFDPEIYVGLDVAADTPFGAESDPPLVVYAKGPARHLTDVSFLLARLAGQVLSRVRLIFAPELREEITRAVTG